jgi:5'-nucleotidase
LIGSKSEASATAALEVIGSEVPVQMPPQPEFRCELTDEEQVGQAPIVAPAAPVEGAPAAEPDQPPVPVAATANPTALPNSAPTPKATATAKPAATAKPTAPAKPTAASNPTPRATAARAGPTAVATRATTPVAVVPVPSAAATPRVTTDGASVAPTVSPNAVGEAYTVVTGDTLPAIAQKVYGDASQWRRIYDANRSVIGSNPNLVKVGVQLVIPPQEP